MLGIVDAELHAVFPTGGRDFGHKVTPKRGGVHDVEGAGLRAEQGKAIVVLRVEDHITRPRLPNRADPLVGIEPLRVKDLCGFGIFRHRRPRRDHHPFGATVRHPHLSLPDAAIVGIEPEVEEEPEARLAEPFHLGVLRRRGFPLVAHDVFESGRRSRSPRLWDKSHAQRGQRQHHPQLCVHDGFLFCFAEPVRPTHIIPHYIPFLPSCHGIRRVGHILNRAGLPLWGTPCIITRILTCGVRIRAPRTLHTLGRTRGVPKFAYWPRFDGGIFGALPRVFRERGGRFQTALDHDLRGDIPALRISCP